MFKLIENQFIFFPDKYPVNWEEPDDYNLTFENVWLDTGSGQRIHGWWIPTPDAKYTVIFCHGNGGNIGIRLSYIEYLLTNLSIPISMAIFDYRGYGKSTGTPFEKNLYSDANLFTRHICHAFNVERSELIVLGRSLGSAVATHLTMEIHPAGLILECPISSAYEMTREIFHLFPVPAAFISQKFDNLARISQIHCPKLIIHGTRDRTVPFHHGEKLYQLAGEPRNFISVPGGDHGNLHMVGGADYINAWDTFIESLDMESGKSHYQ